MRGQRYWIKDGRIEHAKRSSDVTPAQEDTWLSRDGGVRLTTGERGTEVKWVIGSPCFASVLAALHGLKSAKTPIVLRFHLVGWFEEIHDSAESAIRRMEEILARGDRYIASRTFTKETDLTAVELPDMLRFCLESTIPPDDYTVDCEYDPGRQQYFVHRVGPKSAIGRVWGTRTSSHPCQTDGAYGLSVAETYQQVLATGKPRYDQVIAALRLPDDTVHWVPYHRIIFPRRQKSRPVFRCNCIADIES